MVPTHIRPVISRGRPTKSGGMSITPSRRGPGDWLIRLMMVEDASVEVVRSPEAQKLLKRRLDVLLPESVAPLAEAVRHHMLGQKLRGIPPSRIVVLIGPLGSGKTSVCEKIAQDAVRASPAVDVRFVRPSDIFSKWYGESERKIASLFVGAQQRPRLIVFDDFDSFVSVDVASMDLDSPGQVADLRVRDELIHRLDEVADGEVNAVVVFTSNSDRVVPEFKKRARIIRLTYTDEELLAVTELLLKKHGVAADPSEVLDAVKEAAVTLGYRYVVPGDIDNVLFAAAERARREGRVATIEDVRAHALSAKEYVESSVLDAALLIKPKTTLADVGGMKRAKEAVVVPVAVVMLSPSVEAPRGILLYGPPGTGKTTLARALAGTFNATFLYVKLTDIYGHKDPLRVLSDVFREARKRQPSIVFFDEFDAIAADRRSDPVAARIVNHLLQEIEGLLQGRNRVIVIAATNFVEKIDPAIISRFQPNVIYVGLPETYEELREIHEVYVRKYNAAFTAEEALKLVGLRIRVPRMIARLYEEAERLRQAELVSSLVDNPSVREVFRDHEERRERIERLYGRGPDYPLRLEHLAEALRKFTGLTETLTAISASQSPEEEKIVGRAIAVAALSLSGEGVVFPVEAVSSRAGSGEIEVLGADETVLESAKAAKAWLSQRYPEVERRKWTIQFITPVEGTGQRPSGPSAGLAIVAAMWSELTGTPLRQDVALSGKISAKTGIVGPVGGWDSANTGKITAVLAADSIKYVVVPEANRLEYGAELRENTAIWELERHGKKIFFVRTIYEALRIASGVGLEEA